MGEMVTIPAAEYQALRDAAENLADLRAHDRAMAAIARGDEEFVPEAFAKRLIAGESPLRVWRELRGLTQAALATASGVNRVQIANIESGAKSGSIATLRKLADALGIAMDDLA
jgi:DNA-binding XRE family transcriptional regulator